MARDDLSEDGSVGRLKRRADFLRVAARRVRVARPAFVLQAAPAPEGEDVRIGFTASRKVGNAVIRNRAKRRLRAAARELLPLLGRPGHDYVLVARGAAASQPFTALLADITGALKAAHRLKDRAGETGREE